MREPSGAVVGGLIQVFEPREQTFDWLWGPWDVLVHSHPGLVGVVVSGLLGPAEEGATLFSPGDLK